jgi:hypothetical protein
MGGYEGRLKYPIEEPSRPGKIKNNSQKTFGYNDGC